MVELYIVKFIGQGNLNHHGLFIPYENGGDVGTLYHAKGSAPHGFNKEQKPNYNIIASGSYIPGSKDFIKEVDLDVFEAAVNATPGYAPVSLRDAMAGNFKNCQTWVDEVLDKL